MDKLIQIDDHTTQTFQANSLQNFEEKTFVQINAVHQYLTENNLLINPD